jgi:methionyl-tRNA formyltransferase
MKIFIDGFGVVAHSITRKLIENHNIDPKDIYINTYHLLENSLFMDFITVMGMSYKCSAYNSEYLYDSVNEFLPDIIISLYGRRIIPVRYLKLARLGTFNLHPSLLPQYKGCFSSPWAIINLETIAGITIHEMVENVDCGRILYQESIAISDNETGYSLWHKTASRFVAVFDEFFKNYLAGNIKQEVMPCGGSYYARALPFDGVIDESWDEAKVDAFIRAMHFPPFKGALLKKNGSLLEIESIEQFRLATSK